MHGHFYGALGHAQFGGDFLVRHRALFASDERLEVLEEMELTDYKVRVLSGEYGTEAKVRVLIESTDGKCQWRTVGVSINIIEASWQALIDSVNYKLMKEENGSGS